MRTAPSQALDQPTGAAIITPPTLARGDPVTVALVVIKAAHDRHRNNLDPAMSRGRTNGSEQR